MLVLAPFAGVIVFVVSALVTARLSARPLVVGVTAFGASWAATTLLAAADLPVLQASLVGLVTIALMFALLRFTVLKPMVFQTKKHAPDPAVRFWDLSTGSRIAYWKHTPQYSNGAAPLVYLHGGREAKSGTA